jgi:hypothetical protein
MNPRTAKNISRVATAFLAGCLIAALIISIRSERISATAVGIAKIASGQEATPREYRLARRHLAKQGYNLPEEQE